MSSKLRAAVALCAIAVLGTSAAEARPDRAAARHARPPAFSQRLAFMGTLHDGRVVTVYADGRATFAPPRALTNVTDRRGRIAAQLRAARAPRTPSALRLSTARYGPFDGAVSPPVRARILFDLEHPPQRYVPGRVVVVFKPGVSIAQDHQVLTPAAAAGLRRGLAARRADLSPHPFTTDARTNLTLMKLGIDRADRLFAAIDRGTLASMRGRAEARVRHPLTAFDNAFVLHASAASVENAVRALRANPSVAYAAPDYAVSSMLGGRHPVPASTLKEIGAYRRAPATFGRAIRSVTPSAVPTNSAVTFSLQALLNARGVDAVAAFDEIGRRYGQLPGTGEIVTNVGIGDVDDASAATNPNDPCQSMVQGAGPTTHLIGGQRYLDWPTLPLIPVWTADAVGTLSSTNEVCGVDPELAEVGLDFSVMAPLPDGAQRPGEAGTIGTDLLGIAPGASYRWVAPSGTNGIVGATDTLGGLIAASRQVPAPNVITASIGFGADAYGFPSRYLEDDPLAQSIVAGIVASNIVVCLSANDGTRPFTAVAVGPSGGSAPTNAGLTGTTTIDDLFYTTAASVIPDSGAIDAGASTLDDIFSANPQNAASGALANQSAFTTTRYNGGFDYSSGFGSRVNLSAPGDNVQAFFKADLPYDAVATELVGGTSASAPEIAAAAAVALQVARVSGHPFNGATQVRDALVAAGTPVATPMQSDVVANVGPQVSVRRVVEQLLSAAGTPAQPGIARVAVQGRRSGGFLAQYNAGYIEDAAFVTALDPSYIKLDGPYATMSGDPAIVQFPGSDTAADLNSYITIAPDWEGIPANATYRLAVAGAPSRAIATTPSVRLLPAQLFAAAGVPLTPGVARTLTLTYSAVVGLHVVAQSTFQLGFGPPASSSRLAPAPVVPPVVSGSTIPVTYDLRGYPSALLSSPTLNVSFPGVGPPSFFTGAFLPSYSAPLSGTNGTVNVPTSALAGAGTYAVWIALQPSPYGIQDNTDPAFVRVDTGVARPPAPLLSLGPGTPAMHLLYVPWKSPFSVTYDVSNVPGATGAIVELSAPPPGPTFTQLLFPNASLNTFRNPNGSAVDDNGLFTGSIFHQAVGGTSGSVTIDPTVAGIPATASVNVRVLPAAGATPIGEASDAVTLGYLGIEPVMGWEIWQTFLDPNGTDGYLAESASFGTFFGDTALTPVETFDLAGGSAITGIPLSFTMPIEGVSPFVQSDTVVADQQQTYLDPTAYYRAAPPSSGFGRFNFPPGTFSSATIITAVAPNSSPTASAYLGADYGAGTYTALRGDVTTGSFGAPIDVTSAIGPNADFLGTYNLAYDPGLDRGYLLLEDATVPCGQQSPRLVTIDFTAGTVSSRTLPVAAGNPIQTVGYAMALDPVTHVAAIATGGCSSGNWPATTWSDQLALLDLQSGTLSTAFQHALGVSQQLGHGLVFMAGGDSAVIGIDPVNHLVLQRSIFCPSLPNDYDLNFRPCLNEYDESGRLVKSVRNLFSDATYGYYFNGVNGTTRTGLAFGQELYNSLFITSTDVQPYSY